MPATPTLFSNDSIAQGPLSYMVMHISRVFIFKIHPHNYWSLFVYTTKVVHLFSPPPSTAAHQHWLGACNCQLCFVKLFSEAILSGIAWTMFTRPVFLLSSKKQMLCHSMPSSTTCTLSTSAASGWLLPEFIRNHAGTKIRNCNWYWKRGVPPFWNVACRTGAPSPSCISSLSLVLLSWGSLGAVGISFLRQNSHDSGWGWD